MARWHKSTILMRLSTRWGFREECHTDTSAKVVLPSIHPSAHLLCCTRIHLSWSWQPAPGFTFSSVSRWVHILNRCQGLIWSTSWANATAHTWGKCGAFCVTQLRSHPAIPNLLIHASKDVYRSVVVHFSCCSELLDNAPLSHLELLQPIKELN